MDQLEGFCSASLLVNRATGRAVSSATYDSVEALEHNRKEAESVRAAGLRESGAQQIEVAEFELAVPHLRVPEMA